MKREKRKRENGYLTVEAAMVFPVVLAVQILIVYLLFFQYDRCLLNQDAARLVVLGCGEEERKKSELADYLRECSGELSQEKYAAWNMDSLKMEIMGNTICIEGSGRLRFPGIGWGAWSKEDFRETSVLYQSKKLHPVIWIRQCRKGKGEK